MRIAVGVATALVLVGCGDGSTFDREAVITDMGAEHVDRAFLDAAAALCEEDSDNVYELAVAMLIDDGSFDAVTAQAIGCTDRYGDIATTNGWPLP